MRKSSAVGILLAVAVLAGCGKEGTQRPFALEEEASLSSLSDITGAENRRSLLGRKIVLDNVVATSVVGDVTFWVGETNNTVLVVKGSELRTGEEGKRIQRGQRYRISGVIRLVETIDRQDATWKGVDGDEWTAVQNALVYVESTSIEIVR